MIYAWGPILCQENGREAGRGVRPAFHWACIAVEPSTKSSTTVKNLTSGTKYWIRVAAFGAAGQGPWSDPATKVAP